jgi:hypothetical protein
MNKCNNRRRKPASNVVTYKLEFGDPNHPDVMPDEVRFSNAPDDMKELYMLLLRLADPVTRMVTIDLGDLE